MKHLKKLSVVLILTTLFSVSFTSCIDDEVSPVVEAIYQGQADLLAADARLQDAQAAYYSAQAAAENAAAESIKAATANSIAVNAQDLIAQIAETELAVEEARIAMLQAQALFDQELAQIADAIRIAANTEAGIHAKDYATAMYQLDSLKGEKLTLLGTIAKNELYMKSDTTNAEMTWEVYLAGLERDVLAKEASVTASEEYIVRATAYLGDLELMQAALDAAEAAETAKQDEIDALVAERGYKEDLTVTPNVQASGILGDLDTEYTAFIDAYDDLLVELNDYKEEKVALEEAIVTLTDETIPDLEAIIADYDGITDTLTDAVAAVVLRIGAEEDNNHSSNHAPGFGLLGDIEAIVNAIGVYPTLAGSSSSLFKDTTLSVNAAVTDGDLRDDVYYDVEVGTTSTPLTSQMVLWNADLAVQKADDALAVHNYDFAQLVGTYNDAADALANATDPSIAAGVLDTAQDTETDAATDLATAQDAYALAQTAFEAAPAGSVTVDAAFITGNVDDLGEIGIVGDGAATKTYKRVTGFTQTFNGSGFYVPSTFSGQFTVAGLATEATSIITSTTAPNDRLLVAGDKTQIVVWEQNGDALDVNGATLSQADVIITGSINPTASTAVVGVNTLFGTEVLVGDTIDVNSEQRVVTAITDALNLTVATAFTATGNDTALTKLNHDKIATGAITLNGPQVVLADSHDVVYFLEVEADDTSATNLATFNIATNELGTDDFASKAFTTDGEPMDGTNEESILVATDTNAGYKMGWDGTSAFTADTLTAQAVLWNAQLAVAIAQYDVDNSQGDYDALLDEFTAQKLLFDEGLITKAALQDDVDAAVIVQEAADDVITDANADKALLEAELGLGTTYSGRTTNTGNLILTWDEHANDGVEAGDEMYEYDAAAGYDSNDDGDLDSLTAYAEWWNAQNALAVHEDTDLTSSGGYNEQLADAEALLVTKTNEVAEHVILIARWQADVDALTAEYDALMATPLYAALNVRLLEIADEIAVLTAEKAVLTTEKGALALDIEFGDFTTPATTLTSVTNIEAAIVAAQTFIDVTAPAELEVLAAKIALGEVSVAKLEAEVVKLKAEVLDLDALIAAKIIEADGYLALLQAALAS